MSVFEVNSKILEKEFYNLPHNIYKGNPNWFAPIGTDLDQIFNPEKNSLYINGDLKLWIAIDRWNNISGRIAAFYSRHEAEIRGGFGFIESTEDYDVTKELLETAFVWLKKQGCQSAEGPINFGEKDRFWGMLTKGFDLPVLYLENYNDPYLEKYLKRFGLTEKDTINTYEVKMDALPSDRLKLVYDRMLRSGRMKITSLTFDRYEEAAKDIHDIYTSSFMESKRLKLLIVEDVVRLIRLARPLLDDGMIWLAYYDNVPVGFLAFMKDLNALRSRESEGLHLKGFGFAVKPGYRKMAVELGLSYAFIKAMNKAGKKCTLYFTGVNEKTDLMLRFMKKLNATISRQHKTYSINLNNF